MALTTSAAYKTAIAENARTIDGYVLVDYSDRLPDSSQTPSATDENRITQTDQVVDGTQNMQYKWFTLEGDSLLDGTFHPCPDTPTLAAVNKMGWFSESDSGATGNFLTPPELTVTFDARDVAVVFIAFDTKRQEYAPSFDIELFSTGDVLEKTINVTGHTSPIYSTTFAEETGIVKAVVTINSWSEINHVVKLASVQFGFVFRYGADQLTGITVTEERELSNDAGLPVGNISANTCSLNLVNVNREFDANNTSSILFGLVKPWVRVEPFVGIRLPDGTIEYVPLGVFWTKDWNVEENGLGVSVDAQDRLSLLETTNFTTGTIQTNQSISALFTTVLTDAGLSATEYNIDPTLAGTNYVIPVSWFDSTSHRQALAVLASAAGASVYADRLGVIQIEAVDYLNNNKLVSERTYDRDNYMSKDTPAVYTDLSNDIRVPITNIQQTVGATIYTSQVAESIGASTTTTYTIFPQFTVTNNQVATISPAVPGVTITGQTWYSWGGNVTVQNTNGTPQTFFFSVTGDHYDDVGGGEYTVTDPVSISENGQATYRYTKNFFVQSRTLAQNIGDSLITAFADPQRDLSLSFEPGGDPSLELGDRITVVDRYTSKEYNITRQEIAYNGGLSIRIDGRIAP